MLHVPITELTERMTELAARAEAGERIVVTRDGVPVMELGPVAVSTGLAAPDRGIDWEAGHARKAALGIESYFPFIAADFDAPLPEDVLITPESGAA
jgi:antitoxin (DNA-binding transcriptional repressor) of toxin-antitoxin stability system